MYTYEALLYQQATIVTARYKDTEAAIHYDIEVQVNKSILFNLQKIIKENLALENEAQALLVIKLLRKIIQFAVHYDGVVTELRLTNPSYMLATNQEITFLVYYKNNKKHLTAALFMDLFNEFEKK